MKLNSSLINGLPHFSFWKKNMAHEEISFLHVITAVIYSPHYSSSQALRCRFNNGVVHNHPKLSKFVFDLAQRLEEFISFTLVSIISNRKFHGIWNWPLLCYVMPTHFLNGQLIKSSFADTKILIVMDIFLAIKLAYFLFVFRLQASLVLFRQRETKQY